MSGEGLTSFGKMPKEAEGKGEEREKEGEKVPGKDNEKGEDNEKR